MTLIIEAGATKTSLSLAGSGIRTRSEGLNFISMPSETIVSRLEEMTRPYVGKDVDGIALYAAGIVQQDGELEGVLKAADEFLESIFPGSRREYASDLLAAARSVCGHGRGIAIIMGTGSNCCVYDGSDIVANVRPGGFILGDEGGAASLGKMFLADQIKGLVPADVSEEIGKSMDLSYMEIVRNVYKSPAPSAYLGSFAPHIMKLYDSSVYIRTLVKANTRSFITRSLQQVWTPGTPVGIVGGFGYACRDIIREVAAEYAIPIETFIAAPIDGLESYHS